MPIDKFSSFDASTRISGSELRRNYYRSAGLDVSELELGMR
jgi:hypothetical protein